MIRKFAYDAQNILGDGEYKIAQSRLKGNQAEVASSKLNNKALKQVTAVAADLAQYVKDQTGQTIDDSMDNATLAALIRKANYFGKTHDITANSTLSHNDMGLKLTASVAGITITLPVPSHPGEDFHVKNTSGGPVTISGGNEDILEVSDNRETNKIDLQPGLAVTLTSVYDQNNKVKWLSSGSGGAQTIYYTKRYQDLLTTVNNIVHREPTGFTIIAGMSHNTGWNKVSSTHASLLVTLPTKLKSVLSVHTSFSSSLDWDERKLSVTDVKKDSFTANLFYKQGWTFGIADQLYYTVYGTS